MELDLLLKILGPAFLRVTIFFFVWKMIFLLIAHDYYWEVLYDLQNIAAIGSITNFFPGHFWFCSFSYLTFSFWTVKLS